MASAPTALDAPRTITARRPTLLSRLRPTGRWLAILLIGGTFGFPLYWTVTMAFCATKIATSWYVIALGAAASTAYITRK